MIRWGELLEKDSFTAITYFRRNNMPPREGTDPKRELLGKASEVSDHVTLFQPEHTPPYVQDDAPDAFSSPFVDDLSI